MLTEPIERRKSQVMPENKKGVDAQGLCKKVCVPGAHALRQLSPHILQQKTQPTPAKQVSPTQNA